MRRSRPAGSCFSTVNPPKGGPTSNANPFDPAGRSKDGFLACVDPHNAGDIVAADKFDWFELSLDFNISVGGNSGILFHVTDAGGTTWQTGPEVQLQDNVKGTDPQRCGWLYQLYKPEIDPKTKKTLDATKPAGEWNNIKVTIAQAPAKSEVVMNGVQYFEFVYGSDDFKARIAKSKFARMKDFAKSDSGFLALQGDHGSVMFRNIAVPPLPSTRPPRRLRGMQMIAVWHV